MTTTDRHGILRLPGGRFVAGHAPPGGRPKGAERIIRDLVATTNGGMTRLAALMWELATGERPNGTPSVVFAAASAKDRANAIAWFWDRLYGKARETVELTGESDARPSLAGLSDTDLLALREILERRDALAAGADIEITPADP